MEQNAGRRIGFGVNSNVGVIHPPMAHTCRVRKNEVMDTSSQYLFLCWVVGSALGMGYGICASGWSHCLLELKGGA